MATYYTPIVTDVFHFTEEAFDDVAHGVEIGIVRRRITGVTLCRNDAQRTLFCDLPPDHPAAIGFIGDDRERRLCPVQKGMHHLAIMHIPAGYGEAQGSAFGIYSSVNFARATSA